MINSIQVIDDVLPWQNFTELAYDIMKSQTYLPVDSTVNPNETDGSINDFGMVTYPKQKIHEAIFCSLMYDNGDDKGRYPYGKFISNIFAKHEVTLHKLYEKLGVTNLQNARVNCTTGQAKKYTSAYHTDFSDEINHHSTAIVYLNTNNGGTQFLEEGFIESRANRAIIFPNHIQHAGVWCTDKKLRFVANFNYQ